MSDSKFTVKMLSEVEVAILTATLWRGEGMAINAQQIFNATGFLLVKRHLSLKPFIMQEIRKPKTNSKEVPVQLKLIQNLNDFLTYHEKLNTVQTKNLFFALNKYGVPVPTYSRVQRYLERFVQEGWVNRREFSKKKNSWVYWVSDEVASELRKDDSIRHFLGPKG